MYRRRSETDLLRAQIGALHSRWVEALSADELERSEFHVFSQFGEDGIVQFLVQRVPIVERVFIELGVEDYTESNTRFLLVHDAWRGLIVDSGTAHQRFLEASGLAWRTTVEAVTAFVTAANVDSLIRDAGIRGDIGLLSIDIDGNDLWVLESIESVSPRIVVIEYNSLFGPERAVSVPYEPAFDRSEKHFSHLYWGASLAALTMVATRRGYALVGGNRAGNNAFFVRRDVLGDLPERTVAECWRAAQFRESRGPGGELSYLGDDSEKLRLLRELPLVDFDDEGRAATIADLYGV
jgi:methyltransferase FkbM-like protein